MDQLLHSRVHCCGSQHHLESVEAIQLPLEVENRDTTHDCGVRCGGSYEDWRQDSPCTVGGHESAWDPPHEYVILSPTPALIELPIQLHKEGHVESFHLEQKPQGCGYIAEKERMSINMTMLLPTHTRWENNKSSVKISCMIASSLSPDKVM